MKTCIKCEKPVKARGLCNNHYVQDWQRKNPQKVKKASAKYRANNLELCRKRTRENQIKLNDKKRFGGLRFKVLERDGYKCTKCSKDISGKNMACVHHVDENKENNVLGNLKSLCKSCHPSVHYKLHKHQFPREN